MRSWTATRSPQHGSRTSHVVPRAKATRRDLFVGSGAVVLDAQLPQPASAADTATAAALPTTPGQSIPKRALTDGLNVSEVIKGNWQLAGGHRGTSSDDRTTGSKAVADFDAFVSSGITTFDTADIYGPSERLIGEYIRGRPQGKEGLQVLTKFCKFGNDQVTINQNAVTSGIQGSLQRLGLPSVDLVQFYWHNYQVPKYVATSQYLMEEVAKGTVQHLGVTNFDTIRLQQMMSGGAEIVSNQVQYSLLDRRPENGMSELCENANVKLLPFGTVAGGFLTEKYIGFPQEKLKLDTYSKSKYASVISQNGGWEWFQSLLLVLKGVAVKHDASIANVASRWVLDKPSVAGIIVGARNANHVKDHVQLVGLRLDEEDLGRIDEVLATGKQAEGDCYDWERGGKW